MSGATRLAAKSTITVGEGPHSVAITNNGDRVYVTNFHGGTVSVIDPARAEEIAHVPISKGLYGIALDPASEVIFVTDTRESKIMSIDRAPFSVSDQQSTHVRPYGLGASPVGGEVYIAAGQDNSIVVSDRFNMIRGKISTVDFPVGLAVSPDGSRIYASNYFGASISVLDASKVHGFSDPSLDALISKIDVPRAPYGVAASPDGKRLYVAHFPFDTVSVVDLHGHERIGSIDVPDGPRGVAVTPDGNQLYVTSFFADRVSVVAL